MLTVTYYYKASIATWRQIDRHFVNLLLNSGLSLNIIASLLDMISTSLYQNLWAIWQADELASG